MELLSFFADALASYSGELRKGFRVTAGKESIIPAGMLGDPADKGKKKAKRAKGRRRNRRIRDAGIRKRFGESMGTGGSCKMRDSQANKRRTAVTDDEEQAS